MALGLRTPLSSSAAEASIELPWRTYRNERDARLEDRTGRANRARPFEHDRSHWQDVGDMSDVELTGEVIVEDEETVEGLPVLAEVRPIEPAPKPGLPAVQAAAAAATGFMAGAATVALVRRHTARKVARSQRRMPRRPIDMLPVIGSRTFLVDVHMLAKPGE
jgi:hypothetical protein